MREGTLCYKIFVSTLLDVTDNLEGDTVVPPPDVLRRDGDDPYLVVAADKGTASFSDTANAIALDRDFWLGDAFASGGSVGYDHKKMGITARGGWEAVKRHFRELDRDIQASPFTVVGVGDMSGDVFGNGMLLSPHTPPDRRLRPPRHLHRSRSGSATQPCRAHPPVRPAALELAGLQCRTAVEGRRHLFAQLEDRGAVRRGPPRPRARQRSRHPQ